MFGCAFGFATLVRFCRVHDTWCAGVGLWWGTKYLPGLEPKNRDAFDWRSITEAEMISECIYAEFLSQGLYFWWLSVSLPLNHD
jgi:hypothetical protein